MHDMEIQEKISELPAHLKQEVVDFVEFLLNKYAVKPKINHGQKENPLLAIAGFAEIGPMSSQEIDKDVYNL